ncbi:MAG TPA: PAS domain-containing protein [Candidatus Acidoferrales bacterium]
MEKNTGQRLQLALTAGKIGTWELELPGRVLSCSAQCKANFGRAAEAGFSYEDLLAAIDPADRPVQEATVLAAIQSGENFAMEYRCVWPDGTRHWIEVSGAVVRGLGGEPAVLAGVTQEVSVRKWIENELREAQRRITSTLEAVDVGAWTLDLINDRVTPDRNLTRIFFLTDEEAQGSVENYLRRIHPEDRPTVEKAMQKVFDDPAAKYALEYRVVSRAGEQRWIDIRGDVERDAAGKPVMFRGVVLDITHRKHAEEMLRESRQVLETRIQERTNELFQEVLERRKAENDLRDLSSRLLTLRDAEQRRIARELHDSVGQYMAAALMSLNAIDRRAELSAPGKEALAEAIDTVQQASKEVRVVSYLLHPPLLDELGLTSAIHFYLEGFSQRSGIETKFTVAQDFGRLPIDVETALFRVCQESLTNIHRHSGSKVAEIRLRRLDGRVELEVADQGTGIPAANVLGVGLRGLRERIGQFAGTMKIESNGAGTTVRVGLPLGA